MVSFDYIIVSLIWITDLQDDAIAFLKIGVPAALQTLMLPWGASVRQRSEKRDSEEKKQKQHVRQKRKQESTTKSMTVKRKTATTKSVTLKRPRARAKSATAERIKNNNAKYNRRENRIEKEKRDSRKRERTKKARTNCMTLKIQKQKR